MKRIPLSQSQLGIYLDSAYRSDSAYHISFLCRFAAGYDTARLNEAIKMVAAAHPMLTAAVEADDSGEASIVWEENTLPPVEMENMSDSMFGQLNFDTPEHLDIPGDRLCRFRIITTESAVYLSVVCHHIITDGYSMEVFFSDLERVLEGGSPSCEGISSLDVARLELEGRSSERYAQEREYYSATFGDFDSEDSALYADAGGEAPAYSHRVFDLSLSEKDFHGGSVAANAAMGVALGAFTGRDDVMYSTVYHGRNTRDLASTVSMLVRTLPVRCHLGEDVTVSALLDEMASQRDAVRGKDLFSFADFCSMTGFEQNVLFAYQGKIMEFERRIREFQPRRLDSGDTGLPLTVQLFNNDGILQLDFIWRSDLYSDAMIGRFAATFDLALRQICDPANAGRPVCRLDLISEPDAKALHEIERCPALDFDRTLPIEAVVAERASAAPGNIAVAFADREYTYEDVDRISTVIARRLRDSGIGKGETVGIVINRSEWMVLLPLAIMKAGAAYMPLDPAFPEERLSFMIEDAGVTTLLTVGGLARKVLPGFGGRIIDADMIDITGAASAGTVSPEAGPDDPFVVLYTSGSTGKPKGVTLTRGNLLNFCHDYIALASLTEADRIPGYANFGFDAHMMDIYPTLMAGATLYVLDEELRHDLDALHTFFEDKRITAAFLTTQIAWQLTSLYEFPSLRWLAGGGEKMPQMQDLTFTFANLYGPTECSVIATCYVTRGGIDGSVIGTPIPGYEIRILDRHGRRVPRGVPGELVILGAGVAMGYLNRPELTAQKFIAIDGEKAYRTGDLSRWNENGEIQFMGRMDGMVKLRGLRIELGEIESVAARHECVRQFVAAVKNVGGNDQLAGYYTVNDGMSLEPDELRTFMSDKLTEFMIPASIMRLDSLPVTPNGKIDRRALPVPEMAAAEEIVAASTPEETEMSGIVAEVIGHDSFGVTTNLLRAGLTSLLAMRLVATIAKRLNVRVTSKEAMADPTVRGLIKAVASAASTAADAQPKNAPRRKYYPITENQRGILIDWERNRDALQYNVAQVIRIKNDTDPDRLAKAILATVKAHPALGTRFVSRGGDVMQQRCEVDSVDIPVIELDHEPDREEMQRMVRPFDIFGEPLYRFAIIRHGDDSWLFMDFHHIVFDGVSAMVFFDSLSKAYGGETLVEEEYSSFEWAADEAALMQSAEYEEAEQWFGSMLDGVETTSYPHSGAKEPVLPGTMMRVAAELDAEAIEAFCRKYAVTPSNYFLSAFLQTLHRLTRNETVAITTVNNGRNDARLIDDIGMFVKTLPVVSKITPAVAAATSPADMALSVQNQFNTTRGYDFYPFTEIVRRFGIRPEIMYVYEGGVSLDAGSGPLSDEKIAVTLDTAKVPLTMLVFTPDPGKYRLEMEFDASLYNRADMNVLLDMVATCARKNHDSRTIKEATLLSDEQDKLLEAIRDGEKGDVEFRSYFGALEMQVDKTPDAVALIAKEKTLTFAELEAEANRIANALRAEGVGRGDKVVILLPRDSRLIISIYGVMKAGAAYIPCDPEYPVERIRLITEDSDAKRIITLSGNLESFPGKAVDVDTLLSCGDTSRPNVEVGPDDPAYLIYTSGSTGRPKGVVIHHEAIANYLYAYRTLIYRPMGADEPKVNMLIVTISFDASQVDLGTSLVAGHTLVLADEEECKDVTMLADLMRRTGVEAFDATPSRLAAMLELPEFREAISHCRMLNIGGESIPASLLPKLDDAGFRGLIINEYGPTETTVGSNHAVLRSGNPVTVGRPFYNYTEYIVDGWGGELPIGGIGELVISGRSVGKGYHNLPEKTAESFITFKGVRAYRTGDLARWLPDGDVDVLGRIDHQVKLRGLRIELGEIESVANTFPGVKMSVANVRKIGNVDHLCIWYEGEGVDADELKRHLERHLTDYMVPDSFNPVDKIPVTPNGKLDRKNLPEPVFEALAEYAEPQGDVEIRIAEAFRRTLGLDRVGANDDFFKIGGTSINAIKVVASLASDGLKVSYKDLFSSKTPRVLAALISGAPAQSAAATAPSGQKRGGMYADLLGRNTVRAFIDGGRQSVGNVLLTGATGFLGVHVLHALLEGSDATVHCVVRSSASFNASSRLRTLLFYYFGDTYENLWGKRIFVDEGDLTDPAVLDAVGADSIDTVINCAASVKHFAPGDEIERANVHTVRNIVDWCTANGRRLVHVSTVSVAGEGDLPEAASMVMTEQMLDMGQNLSNQYVKSKYDAETVILSAVEEKGLNAKIIRVGNISPRASDGEFQANFQSNAFMGRLRAYLALGCVPYDHLGSGCEFTPVDQLAESLLELATTPEENIVFHPLNNHHVPLGDVIDAMSDVLGVKIENVENDEFSRRLGEAMTEEKIVTMLQPLVAYQSADGNSAYIGCDNAFTTGILYRLGFRWSPTSTDYIRNFITAIAGLGYFDPAMEAGADD